MPQSLNSWSMECRSSGGPVFIRIRLGELREGVVRADRAAAVRRLVDIDLFHVVSVDVEPTFDICERVRICGDARRCPSAERRSPCLPVSRVSSAIVPLEELLDAEDLADALQFGREVRPRVIHAFGQRIELSEMNASMPRPFNAMERRRSAGRGGGTLRVSRDIERLVVLQPHAHERTGLKPFVQILRARDRDLRVDLLRDRFEVMLAVGYEYRWR